jgi:bisphosphoglycerate-independent phosphoglycerate mutase (AlkP superfamily)
VSDQWLPPFVITDDAGKPVGTVEDGDAVVLFNFRADRMVEISKAFEYPDFDIFDRERYPKVRRVGSAVTLYVCAADASSESGGVLERQPAVLYSNQ